MAVINPSSVEQRPGEINIGYVTSAIQYGSGVENTSPEFVLEGGIWRMCATLQRGIAFTGTALEFQIQIGATWTSLQINPGRTGAVATSTTLPDGGLNVIHDAPAANGLQNPGGGFGMIDGAKFRWRIAAGGSAGLATGFINLRRV